MAAKVPKVEMAGMSARLVSTNAEPVVRDVTSIALEARDQLQVKRVSSEPLMAAGCRV